MKIFLLSILLLTMLGSLSNAQNVEIPDTTFLHALIEEGVDTNGDSLISNAEAEAIFTLNVSDQGISDMTGIEAFINLDSLRCNFNDFTNLDLTGNPGLRYLECIGEGYGDGSIKSLNISNNSALESFYCEGNQLTSLDVSNNTALKLLFCRGNLLTSLDVTNNNALTELLCGYNQLTSLDVSNNNALTELGCWRNQLTDLDLSRNSSLRTA